MQMLGVCVSHETRKVTKRRKDILMEEREKRWGQNTCDMKDGEGRWASGMKVVGRRAAQQDIYENGTMKSVTFYDNK